jgi:hypothetical protein
MDPFLTKSRKAVTSFILFKDLIQKNFQEGEYNETRDFLQVYFVKSAQKKKARDPPAGELTGKEEAASSTETLTYNSFSMARLVQLAFGIYLESLSIQRKMY